MATQTLLRPQQFPAIDDAVVRRLHRRLVVEIKRICPSSLVNHREDIVQAALIRVVRLSDEDGARVFSLPYLRKVAMSAMIDELRRHRRRCEDVLDGESLTALPHGLHDPENHAIARQVALAIQQSLARLGDARRLAARMHLEGHSVPEAARNLGWSNKRVANLTFRGLRDLRRTLTAQGYAGSAT
jgi:RNA polymerase sigma-70 factor (ECF subfamily)